MPNPWTADARAAAVLLAAAAVSACGHAGHSAVTSTNAPAAATASGTVPDPMAGMNHGTAADMPGMSGMSTPIGDGTSNSEFGYTLSVLRQPSGVGPQRLSLVVAGPTGAPVLDAQVEQTKKMHLIVVRGDLTGYQHLHPVLAADGTWSVDVDFSAMGRWHLIADLTPMVPGTATARVALGIDVDVPGSATADTPLPDPVHNQVVDGYEITLDGSLSATAEQPLTFTINRAGSPTTDVTEYLGAGGHLVALEQQSLGYTHLHPEDGPGPELSFTAQAPQPGRYRLFLQFATGDKVHTAAFTLDVA